MLTEEQKRKKREKGKKILKVLTTLMGVVLLIGCCSVGGLMFLGSSEPTVIPVPTLEVIVEPPLPTLTSILTEETTQMPLPTSVPTYTPQSAVDNTSQYREEMYLLLVQYVEAQEAVGELNAQAGQAGQNVLLLKDPVWLGELGFACGKALAIGEKIRDLEPEAPPAYRETHGYLVKATEHYEAFVHLYTQGVSDLDVSLISQATEELKLAGDWMGKATEAMPNN